MQKVIFFISSLLFLYSCSQKKEEKQDTISNINFCASIHSDSTIRLSHKLDSLSDLMSHKTGVYVLEDGDGSMVARAWLSEYA